MENILVTGATGALGRTVVRRLRANENYRIIPISRIYKDTNGVNLDIRNLDGISSLLINTKPKILYHLAATFSSDFEESYAVNVSATRHILDVLRNAHLKTRVILIGSAAEYGLIKPNENPIREDHVLNPLSVYGLTKAWQTQLGVLSAAQGSDVVIARVFNLEGSGLSESLFAGKIEKQIREVLENKRKYIEVGSLEAVRDYISIDHAVEQITAIAEKGVAGNIYHVAGGAPITMRDFLIRQLAVNNLDYSLVRESPVFTNRIGYDVPVIYADINKTKRLMKDVEAKVEN